jgi:hypothetical protein
MKKTKDFRRPQLFQKVLSFKKMKKFALIGLGVLTYCSPIGYDIEDSLNRYWKDHCQKSPRCQLDLKTLTPFDWDELYYFSGAASLEDIEEVLRFKLDSFTDIGDRLVFVKNKKVVYHKEWFKKPGNFPKGIIFEIPGKYKIFGKEDAIFSLSKDTEMIVMKEAF